MSGIPLHRRAQRYWSLATRTSVPPSHERTRQLWTQIELAGWLNTVCPFNFKRAHVNHLRTRYFPSTHAGAEPLNTSLLISKPIHYVARSGTNTSRAR